MTPPIDWLPSITLIPADATTVRYLSAAYKTAALSNDPSTHLGAVVVAGSERVAMTNQLVGHTHPQGIDIARVQTDREYKLSYMEHAERGVIYEAASVQFPLRDATMYYPWYSCDACARAIVRVGIARVVGHKAMFDATPERWRDSIIRGLHILEMGGVQCQVIDHTFGLSTLFNGTVVVR